MMRTISAIFLFTLALGPVRAHARTEEPGRLQGVVIDEASGQPVAAARITIEGTVLVATTDLRGRYVIDGIPVGLYTVAIRAIGYEPKAILGLEMGRGARVTLDVSLSTASMGVRGEWFPPPGEMVAVSGCCKRFDDPSKASVFRSSELMTTFSNDAPAEPVRRSLRAGAALSRHAMTTPHSDAQVRVPDNVEIALTGRLHAQVNTSSVDTATASEFLIRRARIGIEVRVGDLLSGKVEPDFGEGELSLKDAWARLHFHPAFRVTMGQFKRPFDRFELTSSSRILVVERAGGIRGVASCSGPGGLCAFSRFTERLQFADRDIGVLVDGHRGAVTWAASLTNGAGANRPDENGRKSFTGRLEMEVRPNVVVAGNAAAHDYRPPLASGDAWAWAYGADVEIGTFTEGLHVQAGVVAGDNWANSLSATFFTAQTIVTYKAPVRGCACLSALEPLVRVSYGDPDTDTGADHGWLTTPGVNLYFTGRNRLALNLDYWRPDTGDAEWSFKSQMFFYF